MQAHLRKIFTSRAMAGGNCTHPTGLLNGLVFPTQLFRGDEKRGRVGFQSEGSVWKAVWAAIMDFGVLVCTSIETLKLAATTAMGEVCSLFLEIMKVRNLSSDLSRGVWL